MKPVGVFAELGGRLGSGLPSIHDAVRATASPREEALVRYLRGGLDVLDVMERSNDVIDGEPVNGSGSILTDGDWYWREDLAHYVAKHHLDLDPNFLRDVTARNYDPPRLGEAASRRAAEAAIAAWQGR